MMERIQMESLLQFDKDPPELLDTVQTPPMLAISTKVRKYFFFFVLRAIENSLYS